MEESGLDHYRDINKWCPIVCTKCGIHQCAEGHVKLETRPVILENGLTSSFSSFSPDRIIRPLKFGLKQSTVLGWNSRTNKMYDESRSEWNNEEEQWVKIYPTSFRDYINLVTNAF